MDQRKKSFYEFQDRMIQITSNITKKIAEDIYSGNEDIAFKDRHPIYKALLKLEFKDAFPEEYIRIIWIIGLNGS